MRGRWVVAAGAVWAALAGPLGGQPMPPVKPRPPVADAVAPVAPVAPAVVEPEAPPPPPAVPPGVGPVTKLPMPRYVSLRSDRIHARRGPGLDYRKDWVFRRAGLPVKVIEEYGDWRRIVDSDDAGGWVFHSLLAGRRTALITAPEATLRAGPSPDAAPVARAEQGVVAGLRGCAPQWCEIDIDGHRGWVDRTAIWGVGPGETWPQ